MVERGKAAVSKRSVIDSNQVTGTRDDRGPERRNHPLGAQTQKLFRSTKKKYNHPIWPELLRIVYEVNAVSVIKTSNIFAHTKSPISRTDFVQLRTFR